MAKETQKTEVKRQTMRFNDAELSLIKNTFAENYDLLMAMRKVFLQMPLDIIDKDILSVFRSKELLAVVRKAWLPELDAHAPLHQLIDLLMTVEIREKTPQEAYPQIVARKLVIKYLEQQFAVLESLDTVGITLVLDSFTDIQGKTPDEVFTQFTARNTIIGHTEMQLDQLRVLAGTKDETVEQTQKRLQQNSSK